MRLRGKEPMSTSTIPTPDYNTIIARAIAADQVIAKAHNDTVIAIYKNTLATATSANERGFPTPLPAPPMLWGVNESVIANNETNNLSDWPFFDIPYVLPAAPPPAPQPLKLGEPNPQLPGLFAMLGDSQEIISGTVHVENGHQYRKTLIGFSPFSPYADHGVYQWQQIS